MDINNNWKYNSKRPTKQHYNSLFHEQKVRTNWQFDSNCLCVISLLKSVKLIKACYDHEILRFYLLIFCHIVLQYSLLLSSFFLWFRKTDYSTIKVNSQTWVQRICDSTYRKVSVVGRLDFALWGCKVKITQNIVPQSISHTLESSSILIL